MSDLVERLRREGVKVQGIHLGMRVCDEAAVRIEALEAALREIIDVEVVDPWEASGTMQIKARAALAPEQDK